MQYLQKCCGSRILFILKELYSLVVILSYHFLVYNIVINLQPTFYFQTLTLVQTTLEEKLS